MSAPKPAPTPTSDAVHKYPGGEDAAGYRWAFTLWVVLFLGVICVGLLNYLGHFLKRYWPGL